MIIEDYVSLETAKLLKEKGFNWSTLMSYDKDGEIKDILRPFFPSEDIAMPTLQMAMKWLRDEKGIAIIPIIDSILDHEKFLWDIKIVVAKTSETFSQGWVYENPESGYDTAIRYCLENLI